MLSIVDDRLNRNCQGYTRRDFLRVGGLALGGMTLANQLRCNAALAESGGAIRKKSVVFLFLQGGPSHIEMFDPKMTAPSDFRSITGEVASKLAGVTFGGSFPQLAKLADKITIVRSYASRNSGHTYQAVASGGNRMKATMGALASRVTGTNDSETGMPSNVLLLPEAIEPSLKLGRNFETGALPTLTSPGDLGPSYAAFNPTGGGQLQENLKLRLPSERFRDRRALLRQLDQIRRVADAEGLTDGVDRFQQQAFEAITRGVADAFDFSKEDPKTIERYDTTKLFRMSEVNRWGDMRRSSNLLGHQMLLARRLCESGCGFVTVSDCGWDMHSNGNSPKNLAGMNWLGPQVDHAVAAFIEDVRQRGLENDILLVVTGEMGRTPRINKNGGRDHYGNLTSLLLFGGGLQMGSVVGQSDRNATVPATRPYVPANLLGTVMHTLFDIGELRITRGIPRDVEQAITSAPPISEVI